MSDSQVSRRLRPYVEGSLHPGWLGKFQLDFGKAKDGNEVAIMDACMQYMGYENVNANFPFSCEFLTSSKYQQLV